MLPYPLDRYVTLDGYKIRYWDEGQGEEVLVLIHGIGANVSYWGQNIFSLAASRRVIAIDLLGFGKSDKPDIAYTAETLTSFLEAFLNKLNLPQVTLAGHSLGGGLCLLFSQSHPDRVRQLILVSSAGFHPHLPWPFRILSLPIGRLLFRPTETTVGVAVRQYVVRKEMITDQFIEELYELNKTPAAKRVTLDILSRYATIHGVEKHFLAQLQAKMSILKMPILVVWGQKDNLLPVVGAKIAKQCLPQAQLHLFDHCGHIPQIECATSFNERVNAFLNSPIPF